MNERNINYHDKRGAWIKDTVERCRKHGDTVEVTQDGLDFTIKVICNHKVEFDMLLRTS